MSKHTPKELDLFLNISSHLTGFKTIALLGTGMAETYFNTIVAHVNPKTVALFYKACAEILALENETEITEAIKNELIPDGNYAGIGKKIILMWYLGNWENEVISANAYTQGLVWEAAETHPPGAKQPGFDSWRERPIKINC